MQMDFAALSKWLYESLVELEKIWDTVYWPQSVYFLQLCLYFWLLDLIVKILASVDESQNNPNPMNLWGKTEQLLSSLSLYPCWTLHQKCKNKSSKTLAHMLPRNIPWMQLNSPPFWTCSCTVTWRPTVLLLVVLSKVSSQSFGFRCSVQCI